MPAPTEQRYWRQKVSRKYCKFFALLHIKSNVIVLAIWGWNYGCTMQTADSILLKSLCRWGVCQGKQTNSAGKMSLPDSFWPLAQSHCSQYVVKQTAYSLEISFSLNYVLWIGWGGKKKQVFSIDSLSSFQSCKEIRDKWISRDRLLGSSPATPSPGYGVMVLLIAFDIYKTVSRH